MTAVTVYGVAHRAGGISRKFDRIGRMHDAHMIRRIELELPDDPITVTLGHDDAAPIGELVYAELDRDDRLQVVSVIDGDWLLDIDRPVYYSGEFDCRNRNRDELGASTWIAERAYVVGMSLCTDPASTEARPLDLMRGDVRESLDRFRWPVTWRTSTPLLGRALDHLPRGETRARSIVGPPPKLEPMGRGLWLRDAELVGSLPQRPAGALRYGPPGRVISVR